MTLTDYILDIGLIAIVLFQVRGRRLSWRWLAAPLVIVAWAATSYLHSVPTSGNDLALIGLTVSAGLVLGLVSGLYTRVSGDGKGGIRAKAGWVAATAWVLGVGSRLAFQLYATHGGGPALARFSTAHALTLPAAWTAALVLEALAEAVTRTAVIGARAIALQQATGASLSSSHRSGGSPRPPFNRRSQSNLPSTWAAEGQD